MPRPKRKDSKATELQVSTQSAGTAILDAPEPNQGKGSNQSAEPPIERPAYIDGPSADLPESNQSKPAQDRSWASDYKTRFTCVAFEMGENFKFKQRVFRFNEKPEAKVLDALKDNGFCVQACREILDYPGNGGNS